MTATRFAPLLAALLMLAGCGTVATKLGGLAPSQLQIAPAPDAPKQSMTLENRGIIFDIAKVESHRGVEIWAASDGPQVFLRDGVIIGTRGFGPDLMSAQAPTAATLRSMANHSRSYSGLDGTDTLRIETFACTVTRAAEPAKSHSLEETCTSPHRVIRNEFTFNPNGKVINSRQWLGDTAGYTIIGPKND